MNPATAGSASTLASTKRVSRSNSLNIHLALAAMTPKNQQADDKDHAAQATALAAHKWHKNTIGHRFQQETMTALLAHLDGGQPPGSSTGGDYHWGWMLPAVLPAAAVVAFAVSSPFWYSDEMWHILENKPNVYCEVFSPLTSFVGVCLALITLRWSLLSCLMKRAYPGFGQLPKASQKKATREVTEIIARSFVFALLIPVLFYITMYEGVTVQYGHCTPNNVGQLMVLRCMNMSRYILCAQITYDLFAADAPLSWDMTLHHLMVIFQTTIATDPQLLLLLHSDAARATPGSNATVFAVDKTVIHVKDTFRFFEAVGVVYGLSGGGFVKFFFNLRYRLCSPDDLKGQVYWINLSAWYHSLHTFVWFLVLCGVFTFNYVGLEKMNRLEISIMVGAWLILAVLETWIATVYFSIVQYKRKKLKKQQQRDTVATATGTVVL